MDLRTRYVVRLILGYMKRRRREQQPMIIVSSRYKLHFIGFTRVKQVVQKNCPFLTLKGACTVWDNEIARTVTTKLGLILTCCEQIAIFGSLLLDTRNMCRKHMSSALQNNFQFNETPEKKKKKKSYTVLL